MSSVNTFQSLNANFKEAYADKLKNLVPENVKLMNMIKFASKDKQPGNLYHQPVILQQEHGITFATSDDDAVNLNAAVAGAIKDATIRGNVAVLRSNLGYAAASRAAQGGAKAFEDATKYLVANMLRSMAKKLEIEMLYGQVGYGTVAAGGVSANTVVVATAEWAPGIWSGAEGMPIEIRDVAGTTSRGEFVITAVDMELRKLTLSASAATAGVVATDVIWHKGAHGKEFAGVHKILTQTTGTLFGIDVAAYNLFKGNEYPAGSAPISFGKLNKAATRGVEKGQDGKLVCLVNPRGWADMLNDQAALRKFDSSYSKKKMENGAEALEYSSQNGLIEIHASTFVKEGYAYLLSIEDFSRIGSSDVTFKRPGREDEFFMDRPDSMAYEMRLFTDQAIFNSAPGHSTLISGISNAS